jgi:chromosome segregation ATPase
MRHQTMRRLLVVVFVALAVALPAVAHAQSETDRLRDALRSATAQLRSLEDQRAALQARQTVVERERDRLQKENDAFKAQLKDAEQANQKAVDDFNQRLGERDDTLEKWKSAYEEAANVARTKDAERAKSVSEATAFKASNKSCEAKNAQLFKASDEMLTYFRSMNLLDALAVREPVFGIKRVELQNVLQDYRDKILDQKVKP